MAKIIKQGKSAAQTAEADQKVKDTVAEMIKQIEQGGDKTIRELSEKFDKWSPASFRLSNGEIMDIIHSLPEQVITDIKFAQQQIRNFAEKQRASITDIEVETVPGVFLGHKNSPVNGAGCYIPGG